MNWGGGGWCFFFFFFSLNRLNKNLKKKKRIGMEGTMGPSNVGDTGKCLKGRYPALQTMEGRSVPHSWGQQLYVVSSLAPRIFRSPTQNSLRNKKEGVPKIQGLRLPVANVTSSYMKISGFWYVHTMGNYKFNLYVVTLGN